MTRKFTLTVVASADGFIARSPFDNPANWASDEEQALFFRDVDAADWAVMGRNTHQAADRPDRRRIVFSAATGLRGWRRPTQLWLDPSALVPGDLADLVASVRPLTRGLILGGTRVHDWFLAAGRIDEVHLTVEPLTFGSGLPIFSGQARRAPADVFAAAGFHSVSDEVLNAAGTRYHVLRPKAAVA